MGTSFWITCATTTMGGGGGGGAFLPHPAVAAAAAAQRMLRPRTSSRFIPRLLDLESERWGCPGSRDPPPDAAIAQIFKPGSPASSPGGGRSGEPRPHASANRDGWRSIPARVGPRRSGGVPGVLLVVARDVDQQVGGAVAVVLDPDGAQRIAGQADD